MRNIVIKLIFILLPVVSIAKDKSMKIAKIDKGQEQAAIAALLDNSPKEKIDNVNWSEYPYKPDVEFAMAHDGDNLYIKYYVKEQQTMALQGEDFGKIWTDSCVEMFIMFNGVHYYNFEFNSIGKGLASRKELGVSAEDMSRDMLSTVKRYPSIGTETFEEVKGDNEWTLMLAIPKEIFFVDGVESFDGQKARANFYKCGDNLSVPHFISWSKIEAPKPNFHLPQWFSDIYFE